MKKVLTYLGLILAACLLLVACASNKPAEKKKATPTPTERAKADATVLIDTMLGKSSNGFSKLYGENYETWTETKVFEKQVADTIEEKGYTPEDKYTFKYFINCIICSKDFFIYIVQFFNFFTSFKSFDQFFCTWSV